MNKTLQLVYWLLVAVLIWAAGMSAIHGWHWWQLSQVNQFINDSTISEKIPNDPYAQFAYANLLLAADEKNQALDTLTEIITDADNPDLQAHAYYNRANINLRSAMALKAGDAKRIALIELAKQDYRTAIIMTSPASWDVRYNLEVALRMMPEQPDTDGLFDKPDVGSQRTIESKGFRVDLP